MNPTKNNWSNFVPDLQVQNLVHTCQTKTLLNLDDVQQKLPGTQYNPKKFAAVIVRTRNSPRGTATHTKKGLSKIHKKCHAIDHVKYHTSKFRKDVTDRLSLRPKIAVLIFGPGKIVCTGAKTQTQARYIIHNIIEELQNNGYSNARLADLKIENLVCSIVLPGGINLGNLAKAHPSICTYDPQQFPGAIIKDPEIKPLTILAFQSGKLVITGARSKTTAATEFMKEFPMFAKFALDKSVVPLQCVQDPFNKPHSDFNREVDDYVEKLIWKMSVD